MNHRMDGRALSGPSMSWSRAVRGTETTTARVPPVIGRPHLVQQPRFPALILSWPSNHAGGG